MQVLILPLAFISGAFVVFPQIAICQPQANDRLVSDYKSINYIVESAKYGKSLSLEFDIHIYDRIYDLQISGGPQVNHRLCLSHLKNLNHRINNETDANLYKLLDTYGRLTITGEDAHWIGAYSTCTSLDIGLPDGRWPTRYCWAHLRPKNSSSKDDQVLKVGVCLPKSCDSTDYHNKYQLITSLWDHQNQDILRNKLDVSNLYCLPDEDSSLTKWYRSPKTVISIAAISLWLIIIALCTARYDARKSKDETVMMKIYKMGSIKANFSELIVVRAPNPKHRLIVDLGVIDGLKILYMCHLILGHIVIQVLRSMTYDRVSANQLEASWLFRFGHVSPASSVDGFFAMAGLLTGYSETLKQHLNSKKKKKRSFSHCILELFEAFSKRYIRVMPMYLFAIVYLKYIAKFSSSGPLWDYGTSTTGNRGVCTIESWLTTLGLKANSFNPLAVCLLSGWYLASDLQFYLIALVLIIILQSYPQLGKQLLKIIILISSASTVWEIMSLGSDVDISGMARLDIYFLRPLRKYFTRVYTFPINRIGAYFIGIWAGRRLFNYEKNMRESDQTVDSQKQAKKDDDSTTMWSNRLIVYGPPIFLIVMLIGVFGVYFLAKSLPISDGKLNFALGLLISRTIVASAICEYILMASTGHGYRRLNRFLSLPIWKILAKLSLCAMLINNEIISYYIQTPAKVYRPTTQFMITLYIVIILATYLISAILYTLFEAPARNFLGFAFETITTRFKLKQQKIELLEPLAKSKIE